MPAARQSTAERAVAIVQAFEQAGKTVRLVRLDGRRIEVVLLAAGDSASEVDQCDVAFGVRR